MNEGEPKFLTLAEVLDIQHEMLARFGGQSGTRDFGLLDSALATPQASFGGNYLHSGIFEMAAAYAYHIAENQPFIDGNKRAALGAALIFLKLNGLGLNDPRGQLYPAMMKIATHQMTKLELAHLLRQLVKKTA